MSHFIITSAISLAALLLFYRILLEKQRMHMFKRFYLLAALITSFVLPFVTIEFYTEAPSPLSPVAGMIAPGPQTTFAHPDSENGSYLSGAAWGAYLLITLTLLIRFATNIFGLLKKVRNNTTTAAEGAVLVLLDEPVVPHTFLRFVYINNKEYRAGTIPSELLAHEVAHVRQRHTLDILFIEILKIIFWFNPLLYLYKKAIQLNHEFLADHEVILQTENVVAYQQLLLLNAAQPAVFPLTSSLNFSLTKKRFLMMTRSTSRKTALLLKLLLVPVSAGLVALLCTKTVAQEKAAGNAFIASSPAGAPDDVRRDKYYAGVHVTIHDDLNKLYINKQYEELTNREKQVYLPLPTYPARQKPTADAYASWKNKKQFALWLDGKNCDNEVLDKIGPEAIAGYSESFIFKNARTMQHPQPYQIQVYTHLYFEKNLAPRLRKYRGNLFKVQLSQNHTNGNSAMAILGAMQARNLFNDNRDQAKR